MRARLSNLQEQLRGKDDRVAREGRDRIKSKGRDKPPNSLEYKKSTTGREN